MQMSLSDSLSRDLREPIEMIRRSGSETAALVRVMAVIALGSALLFTGGRLLVNDGPLTEFSQVPAEIGALE